jgi:hypothetical protein
LEKSLGTGMVASAVAISVSPLSQRSSVSSRRLSARRAWRRMD